MSLVVEKDTVICDKTTYLNNCEIRTCYVIVIHDFKKKVKLWYVKKIYYNKRNFQISFIL